MKAESNQRLEKPERQDFVETEVKAGLVERSQIGEDFFPMLSASSGNFSSREAWVLSWKIEVSLFRGFFGFLSINDGITWALNRGGVCITKNKNHKFV